MSEKQQHECLLCGRKTKKRGKLCEKCDYNRNNVAYIRVGPTEFLFPGIINTNRKLIALEEHLHRIEDKLDTLLSKQGI